MQFLQYNIEWIRFHRFLNRSGKMRIVMLLNLVNFFSSRLFPYQTHTFSMRTIRWNSVRIKLIIKQYSGQLSESISSREELSPWFADRLIERRYIFRSVGDMLYSSVSARSPPSSQEKYHGCMSITVQLEKSSCKIRENSYESCLLMPSTSPWGTYP